MNKNNKIENSKLLSVNGHKKLTKLLHAENK